MKATNLIKLIPIKIATVLTACAGNPPDATGIDTTGFPPDWASPIYIRSEVDACQDIEGRYSSGGESNSTIGERFSNPIFERSFFNQIEIADETNFFVIKTEHEKTQLLFDIYNSENEILIEGATKNYQKCENGWYVSEAFSKGGSGDNPTRSTYTKTAYGKAEDGSLVIYSYTEVVFGKLLLGKETRKSSIWYRYRNIK